MSESEVAYRELLTRRTAELEQSEERLRQIITHNADGIVIINQSGRVCFSNPAACRLFDRSQAELEALDIGFPVADVESCEVQILRPRGSPCTAEMRVVPLSWENEPAYLASLRDVSERKALEAELRQAQKMEAIGLLAGGVAHDFNNLLTVVIGCSQMLVDQLTCGRSPVELAREILTAAERAADLTRQLLAFSRRQILRPQVLDLNQLVANLHQLLTRLVGETIRIELRLNPEPCFINADPVQMQQVLINLIVNARDALPKGGTINIETGRLEYCTAEPHLGSKPGPEVVLTVSDNGQGIAPEMVGRVFEPFFTTKPMGKGTGLGLSTVYGIVKQSGGDIELISNPGSGTTFRILMPEVAGPGARREPAAERLSAESGFTVLVAEDEIGVRKMVRIMLEQLGYSVLEAANGAEGLKVIKQHSGPINVLLTDVVMPGMGGRELALAAEGIRPGIRVLYMSGHIDDVILEYGVSNSQLAFLQKPFQAAQLARKLKELLAG